MTKKLLIAILAVMPLAGCAADQQMPLVFARTQTAGIGIQGSAADQGASLTLGFNDRNVAVVPVTTVAGNNIRSVATGTNNVPFEDALSVLGQFEIQGQAATVGTSLGTFFSTGLAARFLAEGFRDRLGGGGGQGGEEPGTDGEAAVAPPANDQGQDDPGQANSG